MITKKNIRKILLYIKDNVEIIPDSTGKYYKSLLSEYEYAIGVDTLNIFLNNGFDIIDTGVGLSITLRNKNAEEFLYHEEIKNYNILIQKKKIENFLNHTK